MKKKLLVFLTTLLFVCTLAFATTACFEKGSHVHVYDKAVATEDYLAQPATCETKTTYYYSCKCGVKGAETFEQGEILGSEGNKNAYVFQEDRLMPWLNVKKNITFGIHKKDIDDAKVEKIIQTVGLDKFSNAYPRQLSGGMKQRVSIARAFAYNPDFIMMDEPFSALDFFTREQMQNELLRINKTLNCSILFVTHSIDEALTLGDKIVILEKGIIKSQYEIEEESNNRDLLDDKFVELKKKIINDLKVI